MNNHNVLELSHVSKEFPYVKVLHDINLSIKAGESVALIGVSGSGKSTLLHIAALLEKPSTGEVIINGISSAHMDDQEKTKIRKENIGFVYQFHNLLSEFTSLENVMIPLLINGVPKKEAVSKATDMLSSVGLSHRINQYPKKLSGGEQQRVAIARALVINPKLIIADEPTGNLDNHTSLDVFDLFVDMANKRGTALLMATHNTELAQKLQKVIPLECGSIHP